MVDVEVLSKSSLKDKKQENFTAKTKIWKPLTWQNALKWDWSITGKFLLQQTLKFLSEFSWSADIFLLWVVVERNLLVWGYEL